MKITYETNGKGVLGWINDYPGSYLRGKTVDEAKAKIVNEIIEYGDWIGKKLAIDNHFEDHIVTSLLMIEDADSDIILESEMNEYNCVNDFESELSLLTISSGKVDIVYQNSNYKDEIDKQLDRNTFYGKAYSTIDDQFMHILKVQNYYMGMINEEIKQSSDITTMRNEMVKCLMRKLKTEGNKLYKYESEFWTIKKIIRRTIWHDRIHVKAIQRMNERILINRTTAST